MSADDEPYPSSTIMEHHIFDAFRRLAYDEAGIALRANKAALLSARIAKRVRSLGLSGEQQYLEYLRADHSGEEMFEFLDAISTNFTSFFRESAHFEELARYVDELVEGGARRLRVWCAAAATGEEPYTLAMTLSEVIGARPVDFKILASDISIHALRHATRGEYERERMLQVPAALRTRYFAPAPSDHELLVAKPALRDRIVWKRINLAQPPFPMRAGLDVIFCRNVMIYFDNAVRQRLVSELERLLRPGGLLVVAHAETLTGVDSGLEVVRPSVYRKPAP